MREIMDKHISGMADRKELGLLLRTGFRFLFHSGVSFKDFGPLNHLGVCMSLKSMVTLQQRMGENFDHKAIIWQKSIECNKINTVQSASFSDKLHVDKPILSTSKIWSLIMLVRGQITCTEAV